VGLFLLNSFKWSDLSGGGLDGSGEKRAKILLFVSIMFLFAALIASIWIMIQIWTGPHSLAISSWPGVALVLQNVLIFLSAIVLRWGTAESDNP